MKDQNHLTVRVAVAAATTALTRAGVASPRTDAELLAAHTLGITRGRLPLVDAFAPEPLARFRSLVASRTRRIPLQHLIGSVAFGAIDIEVGSGAFVPRPETELLVDWALGALDSEEPIVVDLCAGTGAIALAIAHARADATVYAVENDPVAATWLRRNATVREASGDHPIRVVDADVTDPTTLAGLDGSVAMLLCNPPYVPDGTPVPAEVSDHDPHAAVFGGPDGLAVIRPVIARAVTLLAPGGRVGIEHDDTHGETVPELFLASGRYAEVAVHADLAGRPRFTTARSR